MTHNLKTFGVLAAASAVVLTAAAGFAQPPAAPAAAAPAPIQAALQPWSVSGPNQTVRNVEGPDCTVFRPANLAASTPIVLWANGRDQAPARYATMLDQLASRGFVVAAANAPRSGAGAEPLACLDYLTAENGKAGSPYQGKLDLAKVGAAGHSMGGGSILMAGKDARIKATAPIMPYTAPGLGFVAGTQGEQKGPMLILSGSADTTAAPATHQKPVFDGANVPVVWATLAGAVHAAPAVNDSGELRPVVIAWFMAKLKNDVRSNALFAGPACGLCSANGWTVERRNGG